MSALSAVEDRLSWPMIPLLQHGQICVMIFVCVCIFPPSLNCSSSRAQKEKKTCRQSSFPWCFLYSLLANVDIDFFNDADEEKLNIMQSTCVQLTPILLCCITYDTYQALHFARAKFTMRTGRPEKNRWRMLHKVTLKFLLCDLILSMAVHVTIEAKYFKYAVSSTYRIHQRMFVICAVFELCSGGVGGRWSYRVGFYKGRKRREMASRSPVSF